MIETWEIAGHILEYYEETHQYLVDGICVPSVTQILKVKFGNKYADVRPSVLNNAAEEGTRVHKAIENYEKLNAEDVTCEELKNYKFLKRQYKFECLDNEVPIILFKDGYPIAAGRIDLVLELDKETGLGDIKRTAVFDKEYTAYQLNIYRIGYQQCYGVEIKFLRGLHLRKDKRKFYDLPIREEMTWDLINEYFRKEVEV